MLCDLLYFGDYRWNGNCGDAYCFYQWNAETGLVSKFIHAQKANFRQATVLWLLALIPIAILILDWYYLLLSICREIAFNCGGSCDHRIYTVDDVSSCFATGYPFYIDLEVFLNMPQFGKVALKLPVRQTRYMPDGLYPDNAVHKRIARRLKEYLR